jgi:hypothetical protein
MLSSDVWDVGILGFWMFPPVGSHSDDVSAFGFLDGSTGGKPR